MRAGENQGAEDRAAPDSRPEQLTEYLAKTEYVAGEIQSLLQAVREVVQLFIATIAGMRQ